MKARFFIWDVDWEALEIDGKLVSEGHRVRVDDVLEALGYEVEHIDVRYDEEKDRPADYGDLERGSWSSCSS